jgi:hypothetical protein
VVRSQHGTLAFLGVLFSVFLPVVPDCPVRLSSSPDRLPDRGPHQIRTYVEHMVMGTGHVETFQNQGGCEISLPIKIAL